MRSVKCVAVAQVIMATMQLAGSQDISLAACSTNNTVLADGLEMPRVGLGTAGRMPAKHIEAAFEVGVRLIDTARATEWYDEDAASLAVSNAVARNISRSDIVVVTKLHPLDHGRASCSRAIQDSARKFGGYVDVFLQHYPRCWNELCGPRWRDSVDGDWRSSWRAMEDAYRRNQVRAIGISNFDLQELTELLNFAEIRPHVVQNWMDPFHQDRKVREACRMAGVVYMSYSTLGTQWAMRSAHNPVTSSPVLRQIAAARATTVFEVTLAWAVQRGAIVVPRSTSPAHIRDNAMLYNPSSGHLTLCLTPDELAAIDGLDGTAEASLPAVAIFASDSPADLFWINEATEYHKVATLDPQHGDQSIKTTPGHAFVAKSLIHQDAQRAFTITVGPGETQHIHIRFEADDEEEL